jgi:hypothetical protein
VSVTITADGAVKGLRDMLVCLAVFIGLCGVAHCGTGCALFEGQGPKTTEQLYTTAIVACAATAGYPGAYDREADFRCRAKVDCEFKLPSSGCK